VTKLQRMLTSLVAAIPAAYLVFELVRAMLSHSENLSVTAYVTMGLTLIAALTAVLIPIGVMVGGNRKPAPAKAAAKSSGSDDIETVDDDVEVADSSSDSIYEDDLISGSSEIDLADSSDDLVIDGSEEALETDGFDDFDLDDEDEKPKSKKKKRK